MDPASLLIDRQIEPIERLERTASVQAARQAQGQAGVAGPQTQTEAKKIEFAKDFESILVTRLMEEMKRTVGDWGMEQDPSGEQINGLFWMCLGQDMGRKGGLGLWKDIYQVVQRTDPTGESVDSQL